MIQDLNKNTIREDFWRGENKTEVKVLQEFKNTFTLSHEITLIIPSTINVNQGCDTTGIIDRVASIFSNLFGGTTITIGQGCYVSKDKGLVKESVTLITSSCLNLDDLATVYKLAEEIKNELLQESVAVKIDGKLYLV